MYVCTIGLVFLMFTYTLNSLGGYIDNILHNTTIFSSGKGSLLNKELIFKKDYVLGHIVAQQLVRLEEISQQSFSQHYKLDSYKIHVVSDNFIQQRRDLQFKQQHFFKKLFSAILFRFFQKTVEMNPDKEKLFQITFCSRYMSWPLTRI